MPPNRRELPVSAGGYPSAVVGLHTQTARLSRQGVARQVRSLATERRERLLFAFLAYALLTLALLWPMIVNLKSTVLGGPADSTMAIRGYWAIHEQGGTPFSFEQDYLDGAPEGVPYHSAVAIAQPIQSLAVWTLQPLLGFIGAFNVFLIIGFVLTGFFGFALLDRLEMHPLTSFFGGYVLAFNPWMLERAFAGHAAFNHVWIFLVLILALLRMSERRTIASAALAGACAGGTFLFAAYFGLLGAIVVAVYFVFELLRVHGWPEKLWTLTLSCAVLGVTLLCLLPGLIAYKLDHRGVTSLVTHSSFELHQFGAETASYLVPSRGHPVFGGFARSVDHAAFFSERTLYFGWTTILLAAVGLYLVVRRDPRVFAHVTRRHAVVFAAILLPVAFWSSLRRVVHVLHVPIPTLSYFVEHVTTFYRVYARFGVIVGIALVILAAPALDRLIRRTRWGPAIGCALLVLVMFELLPARPTAWAEASSPPAYDRWLAEQPRGTVVHYPMRTDQVPAVELMSREFYYQMFHRQPLYNINGAGTEGTREDAIRIMSRYITDPNTPGILAAEGVHYVLVHDNIYREQGETPPGVSDSFLLIKTFPQVRVFELRKGVKPVDLDALLEQQAVTLAVVQGMRIPELSFGGGFGPPSTREADRGWRRLDGDATFTLTHDAPNLRRAQIVVQGRGADRPRIVRLTSAAGEIVAQVEFGTQPTQVTLGPFPLPAGTSEFTLRADPPATGDVFVSSFLVQPLADFPDSLRAG